MSWLTSNGCKFTSILLGNNRNDVIFSNYLFNLGNYFKNFCSLTRAVLFFFLSWSWFISNAMEIKEIINGKYSFKSHFKKKKSNDYVLWWQKQKKKSKILLHQNFNLKKNLKKKNELKIICQEWFFFFFFLSKYEMKLINIIQQFVIRTKQ